MELNEIWIRSKNNEAQLHKTNESSFRFSFWFPSLKKSFQSTLFKNPNSGSICLIGPVDENGSIKGGGCKYHRLLSTNYIWLSILLSKEKYFQITWGTNFIFAQQKLYLTALLIFKNYIHFFPFCRFSVFSFFVVLFSSEYEVENIIACSAEILSSFFLRGRKEIKQARKRREGIIKIKHEQSTEIVVNRTTFLVPAKEVLTHDKGSLLSRGGRGIIYLSSRSIRSTLGRLSLGSRQSSVSLGGWELKTRK